MNHRGLILFAVVAFLLASPLFVTSSFAPRYGSPQIRGASSTFVYDQSVANNMMKFAGVAYCDVSDIQNWNLASACDAISTYQVDVVLNDPNLDSVGYIAHDSSQEIIVVAFKGTDPSDLVDWIDDLEGGVYYGDPCNISSTLRYDGHSGFCNYYLSLRNLGLFEEFVRIFDAFPTYKVFSIGHSLGGAAAAIFALDVMYNFEKLTNFQLLTYGQPRVGDVSFGNLMSQYDPDQIWRIIHNVDVVPHLAPCCEVSLFNDSCTPQPTCPYHIPTEIWYPQESMVNNATYDLCSTTNGEDPTCSDSKIGIISWSISDHLTYFGQDVAGQCCPSSSRINSPERLAVRSFLTGHKIQRKKNARRLIPHHIAKSVNS